MRYRDITLGTRLVCSYGDGRTYEVRDITGPTLVQEEWDGLILLPEPTIGLTLIVPEPHAHSGQRGTFWINELFWHPDAGIWLTYQGDTITITSQPAGDERPTALAQLDMFGPPPVDELPLPTPYPRQEGVDYPDEPRRAWHCHVCANDWNADRNGTCPHCGNWLYNKWVMTMPRTNPGEKRPSTYQRKMGIRTNFLAVPIRREAIP